MNIIPTYKRFASWSMPNRFAYVVGVFAIIGVVFGIFSFFLKDSKSTTNNIDLSTTNNTIIDSSKTNISLIENTEIIESETLNYSISGVKSLELEKLIKKSTKVIFDNNSKNNIKISHTGQIRLLSDNANSYTYSGGSIIIFVNNNTCYEFKSYKIPSMRANPKSVIESELNKVIASYVQKNTNEFSKKIIQCLR